MLEPELIFCSLAAVLAIDEFSWLQHEKEEEKKEKVYSNKDPEKKVSEAVCFLGILTPFQ